MKSSTPIVIWSSNDFYCRFCRYGSKKQQVLTLAGDIPEVAAEPAPYVTADSKYAGGCLYRSCPS